MLTNTTADLHHDIHNLKVLFCRLKIEDFESPQNTNATTPNRTHTLEHHPLRPRISTLTVAFLWVAY